MGISNSNCRDHIDRSREHYIDYIDHIDRDAQKNEKESEHKNNTDVQKKYIL